MIFNDFIDLNVLRLRGYVLAMSEDPTPEYQGLSITVFLGLSARSFGVFGLQNASLLYAEPYTIVLPVLLTGVAGVITQGRPKRTLSTLVGIAIGGCTASTVPENCDEMILLNIAIGGIPICAFVGANIGYLWDRPQ